MPIDEDWIPLTLICACVVIWVSALWNGDEKARIAGDIIQFGFGAVAGYMSRNKMADKMSQLEKENKILRGEMEESIIDYDQN